MKKTTAILCSLFLATAALAQTPPAPFPEDFTPSPCAAQDACTSFKTSEFSPLASRLLGLQLDSEWVRTNEAMMMEAMRPICRKIASCYTIQGANFQFCHDSLMPEIRGICATKFANGSRDFEQCGAFTEIWASGVDQLSSARWAKAQECARPSWTTKSVAPEIWLVPAKIPRDYKGDITVYARDPETKLPVPAKVEIAEQNVFSSLSPSGRPATFYAFKWPVKLNRTTNPDGHRDLVPPMVTVTAEGWAPATFPMPVDVPKMSIEMKPARLKPGRNRVTVTTRDAETGKPVEARVMFGTVVAGESNKELVINVPRKNRPQLWVTDLFERYGDVVIAR
ncbi:MAG TPA: hypothetical protein VF618_23850 [Thermoanaerobaculia bacterium]